MLENYINKNGDALEINYICPDDFDPSKRYPAIVIVHGGGWIQGTISQWGWLAKRFNKEGFVAVLPEYRTKSTHNTTPIDGIEDIKDAFDYIKNTADSHSIDLQRVVGIGLSAGGHMVALMECAGHFGHQGFFSEMLLCYPACNSAPGGFENEQFGEQWEKYCPHTNLEKIPPTAIAVGADDSFASMCRRFTIKALEKGNDCEMHIFSDDVHGFKKHPDNREYYIQKFILFLKAHLFDFSPSKGE